MGFFHAAGGVALTITQLNMKKSIPVYFNWVSIYQENDPSRTVCGDLITDAFKVVSKYSCVWGFGTNCINPKNVSPFLKLASSARNEVNANHIRLIVYPNLGRTWNSGRGYITLLTLIRIHKFRIGINI